MRFLWPVIGLCACWWGVAKCTGESDASTVPEVAQWRLSQRPVVDIGVVSGDPVYELTDASSSLRLDDGGIVVSDVGAGEVRYFDAAGRYRMTAETQTTAGRTLASRRGRLRAARLDGRDGAARTGSGASTHAEGESRGGVTFEGAGRRITFDADGNVVATAAGAEPAARIHRRTLLTGGTAEAQTRAIAAIDRMPAVDSVTGFRIVRLDDAGYLWVEGRVEGAGVRRPWVIHDPQGRAVGRAAMLAAFEPHHIGQDFILGRWRDGNGIEHIRMYTLERDEHVRARRDTTVAPPQPAPDAAKRAAALVTVRRTLQDLALRQEGYWSKTMAYATDPAQLAVTPQEGVEIAILAAGVGGWRAIAYVQAADVMCAIGSGREALPGWEDGRVACD